MNAKSDAISPQQSQYSLEVEHKIDELISWAVDNKPQEFDQLSTDDFDEVRKLFCDIAQGGGNALEREPEPADGGAQYIDTNPAPWP